MMSDSKLSFQSLHHLSLRCQNYITVIIFLRQLKIYKRALYELSTLPILIAYQDHMI